MIAGVDIKNLTKHSDNQGFFREIIRSTDHVFRANFAQLSHAMAISKIIKAWHLHAKQTDWMYVVLGEIHLALYDTRRNSTTYKELMEIRLGNKLPAKVVRIPPGIAHGYKVIHGPMHIIYLADREYDPQDIEIIPHTDDEIGYDWRTLRRKNANDKT